MKKLFVAALLAAVILPFFSSCQKSDQASGNTSNSATFVGQWQISKIIWQYYVDGSIREEATEYMDAQNGEMFEFRADYTFVDVVTKDGVAYVPSNGTYVKTPSMIILTYPSYTMTLTVESLTANEAVVIDEQTSESGGHVNKTVRRIFLRKL